MPIVRSNSSKMHSTKIICAIYLIAVTSALPYPGLVENEEGELFQLVPLNRVRRGSIYGNADITDPGRLIIGARGTPIDNSNHRLDTHVFGTDNIRHSSPFTVGGEANYLHKPTGSTANLAATHTERWGTDLKAAGQYNFFQDKTTNANVQGFASKHLGGLPGNLPTDYGVMFNFRKDF